MPEVAAAGDPVHLPAVLAGASARSTSEARRLIAQGAVRVNGDVLGELDVPGLPSLELLFRRESAVSPA